MHLCGQDLPASVLYKQCCRCGRLINQDGAWEGSERWTPPLALQCCSKLFKEYAIADLSRHKEGRVGLRWRTQKEVVSGRGQFVCGAKVRANGMLVRSIAANGLRSTASLGAEPRCARMSRCLRAGILASGQPEARGGNCAAKRCARSLYGACLVRQRGKCAYARAAHTSQTMFMPTHAQDCDERRGLASFEVPFAYQEAGALPACFRCVCALSKCSSLVGSVMASAVPPLFPLFSHLISACVN